MLAVVVLPISAFFLKRRRRKGVVGPPAEQPIRGPARPPDSRPYDIFLSHRGPDVKRHFCAFLEEALKRAGVRTFVDQSDLVMGDNAWDTMQLALQTAELVMPVFSSGYVQSAWCLDELELMMRSPANVMPVFYDTWPGIDKLKDDVRR